MRSGTRAASVAGMAALVTAGVAACGPGGGSRPAAHGTTGAAGKTVRAAYSATTHTKTAAFRLDETIRAKNSSGAARSASVTGHGQADFATRDFTATLASPASGTVKVLLLHGTEYFRVPAAARSQIPGHKPWVSVNLNKVTQARLGQSLSGLASAGNDNPAQVLSQLAAVSSGVSRAGTATVAGVPTTEYRAHIDLHKVAARAQARSGAKAGRAVRQEIKALGTATLPVEVWVGPRHLVRQIRYHSPLPAASGATGSATLTITFTKFGMPVHLSAPPAGQTADITGQMLGQAGTGPG